MELVTCALLTYLLHSTLLLGAALGARLVLRDRCLGWQEALLRAALVGGVVTTILQVGLGLQPASGAWRLAPATSSSAVTAHVPDVVRAPLRATTVERSGEPAWATPPAEAATRTRAPVPDPTRWPGWRRWLVGVWAVLATLGLLRLAVAAVRLEHLLRGRRELGERERPVGPELVARLGLRPPVRVSTAAHLSVPLATGILRPEVVLPPRALAELSCEEQAALCAHELAHVARRDPAWLLLARGIEALAPLQPLNVWARSRLQDLAECLSDDLAVHASARPLGLARSLLDVAAWTHPGFTPVTASGAQGARSRLGHRVERLMNPVRRLENPGRIVLPVAGALVLATALVTPVISSGEGASAPPAVRAGEREAPAPPPVAPAAPAAPAAPVPRAAAVPAPPAPPAPPDAPDAPEPPEPPDAVAAPADIQQRLERITRRIEERAQRQADVSRRVEAEMQALSERLQIPEQDLERLSRELESAVGDLVKDALATHGTAEAGAGGGSADAAAARVRVRELRRQLREAAQAMRPSQAELRRLAEQARTLAEAARPTDAELTELRRLSGASQLDAAEIERITREAGRQVREELRRAAEEMARAAETMRRARDEARQH